MTVKINKLQEQIPLYINGALTDDAKNTFELALQQNHELKQEYIEFHEIDSVLESIDDINQQHFLRLFQKIQQTVQFAPPSSVQTPTLTNTQTTQHPSEQYEQDSTLIMPREESIEPLEKVASKKQIPPTPPLKEHHEEEHSGLLSREFIHDFFTSARLAWGVVIAQFILLIFLLIAPSGNGVTTIGANGQPISGLATINVVFADNATQKDIRELLASIDAQIANGPTSIGLYTIYVKGDEEQAKNVIDRLKKSTLILLAEPAFI